MESAVKKSRRCCSYCQNGVQFPSTHIRHYRATGPDCAIVRDPRIKPQWTGKVGNGSVEKGDKPMDVLEKALNKMDREYWKFQYEGKNGVANGGTGDHDGSEEADILYIAFVSAYAAKQADKRFHKLWKEYTKLNNDIASMEIPWKKPSDGSNFIIKMKSHFWLLEVHEQTSSPPPSSSSSRPRTLHYRKIGKPNQNRSRKNDTKENNHASNSRNTDESSKKKRRKVKEEPRSHYLQPPSATDSAGPSPNSVVSSPPSFDPSSGTTSPDLAHLGMNRGHQRTNDGSDESEISTADDPGSALFGLTFHEDGMNVDPFGLSNADHLYIKQEAIPTILDPSTNDHPSSHPSRLNVRRSNSLDHDDDEADDERSENSSLSASSDRQQRIASIHPPPPPPPALLQDIVREDVNRLVIGAPSLGLMKNNQPIGASLSIDQPQQNIHRSLPVILLYRDSASMLDDLHTPQGQNIALYPLSGHEQKHNPALKRRRDENDHERIIPSSSSGPAIVGGSFHAPGEVRIHVHSAGSEKEPVDAKKITPRKVNEQSSLPPPEKNTLLFDSWISNAWARSLLGIPGMFIFLSLAILSIIILVTGGGTNPSINSFSFLIQNSDDVQLSSLSASGIESSSRLFQSLRETSVIFDSWAAEMAGGNNAQVPSSIYLNSSLVSSSCNDAVNTGRLLADWIASSNGVAHHALYATVSSWPPPTPSPPLPTPSSLCLGLQNSAGRIFAYRLVCSALSDSAPFRLICPHGADAFDYPTCEKSFTLISSYNLTNQVFLIDRTPVSLDHDGNIMPPPSISAARLFARTTAAAFAAAQMEGAATALKSSCAAYNATAQLWITLPSLVSPVIGIRSWVVFLLQLGAFGFTAIALFLFSSFLRLFSCKRTSKSPSLNDNGDKDPGVNELSLKDDRKKGRDVSERVSLVKDGVAVALPIDENEEKQRQPQTIEMTPQK